MGCAFIAVIDKNAFSLYLAACAAVAQCLTYGVTRCVMRLSGGQLLIKSNDAERVYVGPI